MAGALLFWGWQTGQGVWGVLLAVLLEGARFVRARWEFSNSDLNRISDLCWALFVGTALLLYSMGEDRLLFVFNLAQWLPCCFFPLMLAQAYGNRATMPLTVFSWLLRRLPASPFARRSFNISFFYFALCLLAASASTHANSFFYPGITLLVALALTSARPRRVSLAAWLTLLLLVTTAGEFSHKELKSMQDSMERILGAWIADFFQPTQDPRELQTRIGFPGPIPQSGKIVLRVRPEPGGTMPTLLREATWDAYKKETWSASNNTSADVPMGSGDIVKLLPTNTFSREVEIARYYAGGSGMLVLPHGTFEIDDVPAEVKTNRLGVVTMENGPGLLDVRVLFGPDRSIDSPPCDRDLLVDEKEKPALAQVAAELKLAGMTDRQKIRAVERYFATNFTYTLDPPRNRDPMRDTWLSYFLLSTHTGHCEYFATATVLLLRQAGVSARYVTGFVVPDSARHGDTYLVRARHAHAWALAYNTDTGLWEQIDTTPPNWGKEEAEQPSWWESAEDALSNMYFQFSKWRWNKTSYARYTSWLLVPLILYLIGRIMLNQRRQRRASGKDDANRAPWPGLDSELYLINQQLAAAQLSRLPNEPLLSWQQRLELAFPDSARLRRIFHLHRSLRFDPHGLKKDDRETLRNEARRWLAEFTAQAAEKKQAEASGQLQAPG